MHTSLGWTVQWHSMPVSSSLVAPIVTLSTIALSRSGWNLPGISKTKIGATKAGRLGAREAER